MIQFTVRVFAVCCLIAGLMQCAGCGKATSATTKAPTAAALSKDVVAVVEGEAITAQELDSRIEKMPGYYREVFKGRKRELLEDLIIEKLLYKEALKKGIENDKEVKEVLEDARRKIIISKMVQNELESRAKVTDQDIANYYQEHKDRFSAPDRWKASHILVKTEEEAKAILDELAAGKSFEDLARAKSQDSSGKNGGDLGYFSKGQMVGEFEDAVSKLEVGQISPIVKSQFGYHIIKLTDKKPASAQELSEVKESISNELAGKRRQDAFLKYIDGLKSKAKITINDEIVGKTPAPAAAADTVTALPPEEAPAQESK